MICDVCEQEIPEETGFDNGYYKNYCNECHELLELAEKAIKQARLDGSKYPPNTWKTIKRDNIEHALTHLFKYKRQDTTEDQLAHAICDLTFEYYRYMSMREST